MRLKLPSKREKSEFLFKHTGHYHVSELNETTCKMLIGLLEKKRVRVKYGVRESVWKSIKVSNDTV